jgi:hypothetical protein
MQTTRNQSRTVACRLLCATALLVLAVVPQALSQTGGVYDLTWHTNDGGGSTSAAGGAYSLGGTIGQPDAGASNGGAYALSSGFWGATNVTAPAALQLATAVSRKTHGAAGTFDVPLPVTGAPGVECRSSSGAHTLVFTFNNNVVSGNASVTTGAGSVSGSPTFASNTMTVNLTGVTDVQKITVTLNNVTDSFAQVLPATAVSMNLLIGDTNGNKTVNSTDIGQTKTQSGAPVTTANFRQDVTPNGTINASDIGLVKSRSGASVP